MKAPVKIPRDEFPKSESMAEGMITIKPVCNNDEYKYIRDIEYIERDGLKRYIQLILPTAIKGKVPLVCFITGSAFYNQDVFTGLMRLTHIVKRGIAVASIQYRGSEIAPFPAQCLDAKAAVRFLKREADKYNYDKENIFVMGDSSGGHTALMAGLTEGIEKFEEKIYSEESSSVKGIIEYYAPVNFFKMNDELSTQNHMTADSPEGCVIGHKSILDNPELVEPTVITNYVSKGRDIPPVLIFHGTNDELVPFGQGCLLYEKLKKCGKEVSFYAMDGSHHGGREFWSEEVLDIVENFIKELSN